MVGVGGRSRGCQTCRKRRVKCDERHPACDRCIKGRFDCLGYNRDLKFVDEEARAKKRVQLKREAYLEAIQAEKQSRHSRQAFSSSVSQEDSLSIEGFQDQVELRFMLENLFKGNRMFFQWAMMGYQDLEDCTTTQTMKALSSIFFGRIHRHQPSIDEGMISYSKALHLVSSDLQDSEKAYMLPSLTNILSLCVFEMMASSSGVGFIQHGHGIQRLIELRGPERHQTMPELSVFEWSRLATLHNYLERKEKCFLEEEAWTTVPFLKYPKAKTMLSLVIDRICPIPGLLAEMKAIHDNSYSPNSASTSASPFDDLRQKAMSELQELYAWRTAWESAFPNCASETQVLDPTNSPFQTSIHFESQDRVLEINLYNSVLLLLFRILRCLSSPFSSTLTPLSPIHPMSPVNKTNTPLLLPSDSKSIHSIALEILRTVEYQTLEEHRSSGCFQLILPLRVAFETFMEGSYEWKYVERAFGFIADEGGFEVSRGMMPKGLLGRLVEDGELGG